MKKEVLNQLKGAKSVDEIIDYSKSIGEPLDEKEAQIIFDKIQKIDSLSDDELDDVAGGWKLPWEDDDNPPAPLYSVGDKVLYKVHRSSVTGLIIGVSSERESIFGINPEWEYTIHSLTSDFQSKHYESDIFKKVD